MARKPTVFEEYIRRFPVAYTPELKRKCAFKKKLEADASLKLPRRVWFAFLTPPDLETFSCIPKNLHAVRALKRSVLKDFAEPSRYLHARTKGISSDVVTLALLEILYDLIGKKVLLTKDTYAEWLDVADRFGLWRLRYAMEDAIFKTFDPRSYALFKSVVEKQVRLDAGLVRSIRGILTEALKKEGLGSCRIENRTKNIGGVHRKVALKGKNINDIYDIHGFRILCGTEKECYGALDTLHRLWPHYPERFKDYVRTPKENGYRSIHTVLSCIERKPIEFQLRTFEMDVVASSGPANHADYKRSSRLNE